MKYPSIARSGANQYDLGGVQNRIRKEEKGKKKEEDAKREKKSAGIRGIRGFV